MRAGRYRRELTYVMCYAAIGAERSISALLIPSGFAFASLDKDGLPYNAVMPSLNRRTRRKTRALAVPDVEHPAIALAIQAHQQSENAR